VKAKGESASTDLGYSHGFGLSLSASREAAWFAPFTLEVENKDSKLA
jgi:hypothetical protein